ncbi:hypothetical protein BRPE64_ACDS09490 [Caballeronia insecticola]|uniref:Uncharacterized protein n=1 Tax=Caballeronia insecticola TaxID=758793 RepID=R4WFZ0_9BURK|nr:hypothetical protein BRPE64_ACDS09490 [Caballeronia insecticola]
MPGRVLLVVHRFGGWSFKSVVRSADGRSSFTSRARAIRGRIQARRSASRRGAAGANGRESDVRGHDGTVESGRKGRPVRQAFGSRRGPDAREA